MIFYHNSTSLSLSTSFSLSFHCYTKKSYKNTPPVPSPPPPLGACLMSAEGTLHLTNALQQDHTLYFACALQPKETVMTGGFSLRWHHRRHRNTAPVVARLDPLCPTKNAAQGRKCCLRIAGNLLNIPLSVSFLHEKKAVL